MDRKDLKIQALLEKISNLTTQYENQVADYRVDLTVVSSERDEFAERIVQLEQEVARLNEEASGESQVSDEQAD